MGCEDTNGPLSRNFFRINCSQKATDFADYTDESVESVESVAAFDLLSSAESRV